MEQNPYQAPPEGESEAASSVEPWRKFTIGAAVVTVVAFLGFFALLVANSALTITGVPRHVFAMLASLLCLTVPLGMLAWTFGSVFLLRVRRREHSDSSLSRDPPLVPRSGID
jgi:protein-S-isoprenylcysteine O-methyltransferase Ste14